MKKILSVLLCAALLVCFAACGNQASSATPTFHTPETAGVLFVSLGAEFKIVYDTEGMAVAVESTNDAAIAVVSALGNVSGTACSAVIGKLVETTIEQGSNQLNRVVVIKQAPGAQAPTDPFLEDIRLAAAAATDFEVVLVTADRLTAEGYISTDTATDILLRQLKLTDVTVRCSGVENGLYTLTFEISGAEQEYRLYAATGTVILETETEDVFSPDGDNMDGEPLEEPGQESDSEPEYNDVQELPADEDL